MPDSDSDFCQMVAKRPVPDGTGQGFKDSFRVYMDLISVTSFCIESFALPKSILVLSS